MIFTATDCHLSPVAALGGSSAALAPEDPGDASMSSRWTNDRRGYPTRNEAGALPAVLTAMLISSMPSPLEIIDPAMARRRSVAAPCHRVDVAGPGYGRACLEAIAALPPVDILVFVDGDAADDLSAMSFLLKPILAGEAVFVLGSRVLGTRERGALTPQQIFGNWLACTLIKLIWAWLSLISGRFAPSRAPPSTSSEWPIPISAGQSRCRSRPRFWVCRPPRFPSITGAELASRKYREP